MKLFVKIVIACVTVSFLTCNSQHVSLIGSHLLPIESDYKVHLLAQDLTGDSVINVTLQSERGCESFKVYDNITGDLNEEINLEIPDDLPPDYKLSILHINKASNSCTKQSIRISDISNRRKLFIQLDKPVYKNGDTIKFRTFLMDRKMVPIPNAEVMVSILDGKGNPIKRFENGKTSKIGVFEGHLKVADSPNFGKWRIRVEVEGKRRSKNFQVKYHDEDSFEFFVDTDKEVAFDNKFIFLNIMVKHPKEKLFRGTANILSNVRHTKDGEVLISRTIENMEVPKVVALKIQNDLGIRAPSTDMLIELTVEVVEERTKRSEKKTVEVKMRRHGKHNLSVIRDPYFKPGFDFPMTLQFFRLNGQLDDSLNSLKFTVSYENFDQETHMSSTDKKNFNSMPKNGELKIVLQPTKNTQNIKIHFEFAGTELMEKIESITNQGVDEYMQATLSNENQDYKPSDILQLSAKSSRTFETLHLLVIGSNGLVHTQEFPEAKGKNFFEFSLELTEAMAPESHAITFYMRRDDGVIVYDEFPLSMRFTLNNKLQLEPKTQNVKPHQPVVLKFKAHKGSFVFLSAIDQNYESINTNNEASQSDLESEVADYMNLKFKNISSYQFNRFNAFVMQPMVTGGPCDESNEDMPNHDEDEDVESEDDQKPAQKYFPDVWFDEVIEVGSDGMNSFEIQSPDDITLWRVFGTSVHPTKGFAVGKGKMKVSVKPEIAVMVHTPVSIREGEVLDVEFSVFSFLENSQNAKVNVHIENGDLMNEHFKKKFWGKKTKCKVYDHKNQTSMQVSLQLPANSMSKLQKFLVQPTNLGTMKIRVTASAGNSKDEVEKIIEVRSSRCLEKVAAGTYLIELEGNGNMDRKIDVRAPGNGELVNVYATLSGNMLGPVLHNLDRISDLPMGHPELKMNKFMLSVMEAEYFMSRKQEVPDRIMDGIHIGYQDAISILQDEKIRTDPHMSTWFYAYTTSALASARDSIRVDDREVEKALDYIKTKQNADGSFTDDPMAFARREMGAQSSQRQILTAQILLAFIVNQNYVDKYAEVIRKGMEFLKSTKEKLVNDYEKMVVAYTFAFYDEESSKLLTSSLQNSFLNASENDVNMAMHVETASYLILLKINNNEDPKTEVEWLLKQRHYDGSFYSSHDTLLALFSLNSYSSHNHKTQTTLSFKIDDVTDAINDETVVKYLKLSRKNQYNLNVIGEGVGYATIYYEYLHSPTQSQLKNFMISVNTKELSNELLEIQVDVKLIAAGMSRTNMVIVEVEMPSGYEYYGHTEDKHIEMFEHERNRTLTILYLDVLEANKAHKEVIQAVKVYKVEKPAKSTISVYDYYRPNIRDEIQYDFDENAKQCA